MNLCSFKQSEFDIQEIRKLVLRKKTLASIIDPITNEIFRFIIDSNDKKTYTLIIETQNLATGNKIHDIYEGISKYFYISLTEYLVRSKLSGRGYLVYQDPSIKTSSEKHIIPFDLFLENLIAESSIISQFEYFSE